MYNSRGVLGANARLEGNFAPNASGGAICQNGGSLTAGENFAVLNNVAYSVGGGMYSKAADVLIIGKGALLSGNRGTKFTNIMAGALEAVDSKIVVLGDDSAVLNNTAGSVGAINLSNIANVTIGYGKMAFRLLACTMRLRLSAHHVGLKNECIVCVPTRAAPSRSSPLYTCRSNYTCSDNLSAGNSGGCFRIGNSTVTIGA